MLKRKKSIYLLTVLVVAGVLVIGKKSFSGIIKKNSSVSVVNTNKVSVKVIKAEATTIASNASFKASLEASEEGIVSNKVGGKVIQVQFENGQAVSQGETLAQLDDTDIRNNIKSSEAQLTASESQLNSTQIGLEKIQINLETAQNNYDREKALYDQQAISKVEFENAESALKSAKADLESSKAGIETQRANIQASQTNLDTLRESLKNTIITAPISGVMSDKNLNVGQYVNVGTALGKVKNISPIYAVIEVKESDLNYVKSGVSAKFKLSNDDSTEYDGVIESIDGAADPTSRVFKCKIKIDNKDGKLKPGVFGNIKIATDENKKAITLPIKALGGSEGNYYVFINNNGVAKKQTVTTEDILKDTVEIESGVKSGDSVICTNVDTLQDGDAVKAVAE